MNYLLLQELKYMCETRRDLEDTNEYGKARWNAMIELIDAQQNKPDEVQRAIDEIENPSIDELSLTKQTKQMVLAALRSYTALPQGDYDGALEQMKDLAKRHDDWGVKMCQYYPQIYLAISCLEYCKSIGKTDK